MMGMLIVGQTPAPPISLKRRVPAATPATSAAVPQVRAADALNHVPHGGCASLGLVSHGRARRRGRSFTVTAHDTRTTIDVTIQRIAEVCQCRPLGVDAVGLVLVVVISLRPVLNASHLCLLSLDLSDPLFIIRLPSKAFGDSLVPGYHMPVWLHRETDSREDLRKHLASHRIFHVPSLDSLSKEFRVLDGPEKELNGLPHDPAFGLQGGHGWIGECFGVCRVLRLQTMHAAERFVDKRDTLVGCV